MKQTHKRSCLLDSFSLILGVLPERLIEMIGHDGFKDGFHTQELIEVCLQRGHAVTLIERKPSAINPETRQLRYIDFAPRTAAQRFVGALWGKRGVLTGYNSKGNTHAVAWECNRLWDPSSGLVYPHIRADLGLSEVPQPLFSAWNFLRIDKIL